MERKGHYMKPTRKASAPSVVFTVAIDTRDRVLGATNLTVARRFDVAHLTMSKWRNQRWSEVEKGVASTPEEARMWMEARGVRGRMNWVFAADAASALTLLEWWSHAEACGISQVARNSGRPDLPAGHEGTRAYYLDTAVLGTGICIIGYTHQGTRWKWCSGRQLLPAAMVASQSEAFGRGGGGADRPTGADSGTRAAERSARLWSDAIRRLAIFWRSRANGPFAATVGGLSVSFLRSHVPPRTLCTHSDSDAHTLERSACFGGRASTWFVGRVSPERGRAFPPANAVDTHTNATIAGPLTHLDVRSMYPSLLETRMYPVKLLSYLHECKASEVFELAGQIGLIAEVEIITRVPEYPRRVGERVSYPTGRFVTTLTGPELLRLKDDGEIVKCHRLAMYKMASPFAAAARALLDIRQEADDRGHKADSDFAKLLANNMGGKLAQRSGRWIRWVDQDTPGEWGEQWHYHGLEGKRTRVRYLAGLCWRWEDDTSGKGPYTFAFAYLAAYGRLMMRDIRERLPERTVVSQDTDGLWVLGPALDVLADANEPQADAPGHLRVTERTERAQFFGPRHYVTDAGWTLAGFSNPTVSPDGRTITDTFEQAVWHRGLTGAPTETITSARKSQLKLWEIDGRVGEDGWVMQRHTGRVGPVEREGDSLEGDATV